MNWFYNLKLTKKLSITFAVGVVFNLAIGAAALAGLGDAGGAAEWRGAIIGLMAANIVLGGWINYFIVYKVVYKSLWWAIRSLEKVAEGDLTQNIKVKSHEEIGQIFTALKMTIEKMRDVSSHINQLTRALAENSGALLGTTESMNRNAHEQAGQTDQAASAVMEMSQSFGDVAGNAEKASQASRDTSEAAKAGFDTVEDLMEEMRKIVGSVDESSDTIAKLGESSRQIGEIVATIEEVADMTNLLALNAAIEAARAGEYGRGFAVVADEVRSLAERTGKATHEITAMIKSIQADTDLAVTAMMNSKTQAGGGLEKAEEASAALRSIVEVSERSMDMINTIATATEQQSCVSSQIASNVEQIAGGTRTTEAAADQIQGMARDLSRLSSELEDTARWFKVA